MCTLKRNMNELFNKIFEQYAMYAIKEISPNIPTFDYNFQKICNNLDMSKWYNFLKLKPYPELENILQALLHSNYDYLNSDPLHSAIVLDLKTKIEQNLHSLDVAELRTKIKSHPFNIGYLAIDFDYKSKSQFVVKEFCLANFVYIIHEQNCVNWLEKLKYYVGEIKLTKLYVHGIDISRFIRKHLDISVVYFKLRANKKFEFCYECKRNVCVIRQIKYYLKEIHSFSIDYYCR